ncbi:MAG: 3'-5' exonuclease domain-containing protein 2 [Bacteroidales bacterium]|jgi:ribonuclease D|nr:3'-5' exonuclease domain-containing protein 2 [Bacteroidales bacterium]MBO7378720.1 3'-5' exonuclease domain-containing protein 2 [Bacteroidales bacterium]
MLPAKISKEEFNGLPVVEFTGNIIVINTAEQAVKAVQAIRDAHTVVGFDTETRPSFVKGQTYKVSLVQLSAGNTAYLFRLNLIPGFYPALRALLEDPKVVKVGLSTKDDFGGLRKWEPDFTPRGFIDLQHLVKGYGIEELSLSKIYAILFGKRISKRQRLTNWESPTLTDRQLAYAAFDAVSCVEIYKTLMLMGNKIIEQ